MPVSTALPALSATHALFLDFDGTLAPIQEDPNAVILPPAAKDALVQLSGLIGPAIAVISGRDVRDLAARVPDTYWRAGGHGLEICAPHENPPEQPAAPPRSLSNALETLVHGLDGVRLEFKGPVIAVHYRQAPELGDMLLARMTDALRSEPGYKAQAGKMVIEAKPAQANKGRALQMMMEHAPFRDRIPVMVGDDTTDEDAFEAANRLGGFSVKVGPGPTAAGYRIATPKDLSHWLTEQGR